MIRFCGVMALAWMASPLIAQIRISETVADGPAFADEVSVERCFSTPGLRLVSFDEESEIPPLQQSESSERVCCDDDCRPAWTVRAGAITLGRGDDVGILGSATGNPDASVGYYASAARRGEVFDLEGVFFGVADMQLNESIAVGGPGLANVAFDSELYSYEFNVKRYLTPRFSVLSGFRWLDVNSHLALSQGPNSIIAAVNNDLYGFQIGSEANLIRTGRFRFDTIWKGGVYHNAYDIAGMSTAFPGQPAFVSAGSTAYATDLWLSMAYQLNSSVALRWGYQLLWVDNITEAVLTAGPSAYGNQSALYHGLHGMLEFTR